MLLLFSSFFETFGVNVLLGVGLKEAVFSLKVPPSSVKETNVGVLGICIRTSVFYDQSFFLQLFNGDFVDRGSFSMECIMTLLGYKLLFPNHFFLARGMLSLLDCRLLTMEAAFKVGVLFLAGNHETDNMNSIYGFRGEVKAKYSDHMYQLFTEVFNLLPLAHLINKKVLVMHGGLFSSPSVSLDVSIKCTHLYL